MIQTFCSLGSGVDPLPLMFTGTSDPTRKMYRASPGPPSGSCLIFCFIPTSSSFFFPSNWHGLLCGSSTLLCAWLPSDCLHPSHQPPPPSIPPVSLLFFTIRLHLSVSPLICLYSGFCIEVMSALTVLVASNVGIPISSTHCKVSESLVVKSSLGTLNGSTSLLHL